MKHTIISWDCCFRNFYHLIGSLADQDYPKEDYELIFVEQRSKAASDAYNHQSGLKSLQDTVDSYKDRFNVRALFLSQDNRPYHLGICNNAGIRAAKGKHISVMDGDILIRSDFLKNLEKAHKTLNTVINLDRLNVPHPVGVDQKNWINGIINFERCLAECPNRHRPLFEQVNNKGPLISAPGEWWEAIGGYDDHRIWSTGALPIGQDATKRLEIHVGRESLALPEQFCIHPYHPAGFDRTDKLQSFLISMLRDKLISWAQHHQEARHDKRSEVTDKVYHKYKWAIEAHISGQLRFQDRIKLNLLTLISNIEPKMVTNKYTPPQPLQNRFKLRYKKTRK